MTTLTESRGVTASKPQGPITRIYWANAKGMQIANFQRERKEYGQIVQPERPIRFVDHIYSTDVLEEIKYIEASNAFKAGVVIKCRDAIEAEKLSSKHRTMMRITNVVSTDVTERPQGK